MRFSDVSQSISRGLSGPYFFARSRNLNRFFQCGMSANFSLPDFTASTVPTESRDLSIIKCVAACDSTQDSLAAKPKGVIPAAFNFLHASSSSSIFVGRVFIPAFSKASTL